MNFHSKQTKHYLTALSESNGDGEEIMKIEFS